MFNSYEFTFAGRSSAEFGLMLCDIDGRGQGDVPFGNKGSIIETRTLSRVQPIHFGVNYHGEPLQFNLVFGSTNELDRYDMQEISFWLTGHQNYQWLTIGEPGLDHLQFKCLITELKPISFGWLTYAFEATVVCDCPYAYGYPFSYTSEVGDGNTMTIVNDGSAREPIMPTVRYHVNDGTSGSPRQLIICNKSDISDGAERSAKIDQIPSGNINIVMDGNTGILRDERDNYNLYENFNMNFLRLVPGDNQLEFHGDGEITIEGRFMYNTAG